ncbi:MAG: acyl-CoA reductase [Reichenbachiella sp.]
MFLKDRIICFSRLGERLKNLSEDEYQELWKSANNQNSWFTEESVKSAIVGIVQFLERDTLETWVNSYSLENIVPKKIGTIAAGNIPLVGFHDLLSVLISGHILLLKPSSEDSYLMNFIRDELVKLNVSMTERFKLVDRLNEADAYIATGSDNSARYFNYYFKDKPNLIRANRTSVAVLNGDETDEQLEKLGNDIFQYYGLGCRNVSKVFVSENYDLTKLLDALKSFEYIADHHKYNNNYDYNKSIYLVNGEAHLDNGFLLMRESDQLVSPISVLYYERFEDTSDLQNKLKENDSKIQCIVGEEYIAFGQAQCPMVTDYADGVDTLKFLEAV